MLRSCFEARAWGDSVRLSGDANGSVTGAVSLITPSLRTISKKKRWRSSSREQLEILHFCPPRSYRMSLAGEPFYQRAIKVEPRLQVLVVVRWNRQRLRTALFQ